MTATRRELLRFEVPLGALGASLVALAVAFAHVGIPAWIPPAPMVRLGLASPMTGMTRSFVALASGDLRASMAWHPLGLPVFAVCAVLPLIAAMSWVRNARFALPRFTRGRGVWIGAVAAFVAAWGLQAARFG